MLGAAPAAVPELAHAVGPLTHVASTAPPFLLVHGGEDTMVASSHSRSLATALEKAGAPVDLWEVPDADHGWHGLPDARVQEVFTRSLAFARRSVV